MNPIVIEPLLYLSYKLSACCYHHKLYAPIGYNNEYSLIDKHRANKNASAICIRVMGRIVGEAKNCDG
nr:MAG TPA: hypothetical protein [Caudoviricetes sp.]